MEKEKSHICTECFFAGSPEISVGRLLIEFFTNLIFYTNVPFFQKVRHCPECGRHSMVPITSESGQKAITDIKKQRLEKKQCDLCGGALKELDISADTQLCEACQKQVLSSNHHKNE